MDTAIKTQKRKKPDHEIEMEKIDLLTELFRTCSVIQLRMFVEMSKKQKQ